MSDSPSTRTIPRAAAFVLAAASARPAVDPATAAGLYWRHVAHMVRGVYGLEF